MATGYFTSDHFKLLNKWKGQKRDDSNPEQSMAYDALRMAYEVTEEWAKLVQERRFPEGHIDIRKRPTSQGNTFFAYNWAKIYPNERSPKHLAYTIGIDSDQRFIVKIDTVQSQDNPALRKKYEELRGPLSNESPIVRVLPSSEGLAFSLLQLVEWTIKAIDEFEFSYDEVIERLGLPIQTDTQPDEESHEAATPVVHMPINRIYYGPPGTGKTFELQKLLKERYTTRTTEVSPDEWRAEQISTRISDLTWWEVLAAAIIDLGGKAKVSQLEKHPFINAKCIAKNRHANIGQTIWSSLQHHTIEESKTVKTASRHAPAVFDKTPDSTWVMAGDWQDACADVKILLKELDRAPELSGAAIQRYEFVTFHQSYGYEEFVEGLRPVLGQESDQVAYEIRSGAFRRLCERARQDPQHAYAMVIDEVNRGNISKIFGELITLIEIDKRAGNDHAIEVTLPYSGERFSVPRNVDVLGSMNTADRSLALVDTALRRRFEFVATMPDPSLLTAHIVSRDGIDIDLELLLTTINRRIEALFDRDHTIGHAYFLDLDRLADDAHFIGLKEVFTKKIVPLLEEYFFDDWQKIGLVLGDNQKTDPALRFILEADRAGGLETLFGSDHGLDDLRPGYALNPGAFDSPKAYAAIYDTELMRVKPA